MKSKQPVSVEAIAQVMDMNDTAHFVLQGKGGCGKSLCAAVKSQYLEARGYVPVNGDTDPVNSTFAQIKGLNVQLVPIADGGVVVQRRFDPLFEAILTTKSPAVVDNGASTFMPLLKYIKSNDILSALQMAGKQVFIHTIVVGGQAKDETAQGLLSLIELVKQSRSNAKIVVWENEFWGIPMFKGIALADMPWMKENSDVIQGLVKIVDRNSDAFTSDIREMTENHMTLREVQESDKFGVFAKSRVHRVFNDLFQELDRVYEVRAGGSV